jgi:integrase
MSHVLTTSTEVDAAKPINGRQTEYRIDKARNLVLLVQASGKAAYYVFARVKVDGAWRLRKIRLADRESMKLKDARIKATEVMASLDASGDPVAQAEAAVVAGVTFRAMADQWLAGDADIKSTTRKQYGELLDCWACGPKAGPDAIGDIPIAELSSEHITKLLNRIEAAVSPDRADKVRVGISACMSWLKTRGYVSSNPCRDLGKRRRGSTVRERVLSDAELVAFMQALDDAAAPLSESMRAILWLLLLTAQRRVEVAGALVAELEFCNDPLWTIQGDQIVRGKRIEGRIKNGQTQRVPLSRQAAQRFKAALASARDGFVFPSAGRSGMIEPHAVSTAMRRLRAHMGVDEVTPHDLRRTCNTWMASVGVPLEVRSAALNQTVTNSVNASTYTHHDFRGAVRNALQRWADYLDKLRAGEVQDEPLPSASIGSLRDRVRVRRAGLVKIASH